MNALDEMLPPLGHNSPPSDIELLRDRLAEESAALIARRDQLLAGVKRAPQTVADEETCGKIADLVKLCTACFKNAEAARTASKEPHLESCRAVDGFFKQVTEPLDKARRALESRLTAYQRAKAEAERRRREEEAARQRAEAERLAREAEESAAALRTEQDLAEAVTAEALARQAEADAERSRREAAAKAAELSRSRGEFGSVASLRTFFDFRDLDRAALDLEALRPHLPLDALEKAVRSFIRSGGRELRGVEIFENTSTTVR